MKQWLDSRVDTQGMLPLGYSSKLAEFADFASRAKMPSLPLARASTSASHSFQSIRNSQGSHNDSSSAPVARGACQKLGIIEDLPHAATSERRAELASSLRTYLHPLPVRLPPRSLAFAGSCQIAHMISRVFDANRH